uniref:Uncharacterized protein n=1 Tax=Knipowitschia caucasica TaxID=637954 RepID=A0AAV2J7Z0_KNICA
MLRLLLVLVLGSGLPQDVCAGLDPAPVQTQVLHQLSIMGNQVALLVENHQALLLQTSRIATNLQEVTRKAPPPPLDVSLKSRDVQ